MVPVTSIEIKAIWNRIAAWYAKLIDNGNYAPRRFSVDPIIKAMVLNSGAKKVLDVGCGEAYLARFMLTELQTLECLHCVDFAENMLKIAKAKTHSDARLRFYHVDIESPCSHLRDLGLGGYDLILAHLVFMTLHDFEQVVCNLANLTQPGGCLIFSVSHPASANNTFWESATIREPVSYCECWAETWLKNEKGQIAPCPVWNCYRTLELYAEVLARYGFVVGDSFEPLSKCISGRDFDDNPLYLAVEAKLRG